MALHNRTFWLRRARWLAWFTIVYNVIEAGCAITFGFSDESLALLGFGIDSLIESASAGLVLWRLSGGDSQDESTHRSTNRERHAGFGVGSLLILLAVATIAGSAWNLSHRHHPDSTIPGLIIAGVSLSFMFWLWRSKRDTAAALGSAVLRSDAACALGCIRLSATLFIGSLLFLISPLFWWIDSGAAIVIAVLIFRDGYDGLRAAWRGEAGCGCGEESISGDGLSKR